MKPEESLKQKLARYKKTLDFVNEVNLNEEYKPESKRLEEASHPETAAHPTGRTIAQVYKELSDGNVEAVRKEVIKTLSEIDPANPVINTLLNASDISPERLHEITVDFAKSYRVRLQDETNNLSLAEAQAQEAERKSSSPQDEQTEIESEPSEPIRSQPEQQFESQQQSPEDSSQPIQKKLPSRRPPTPYQMPQRMTKEEYAQYKENNKKSRDEKARKLREDRKKRDMTKEDYGRYKQENNEERRKRAEELWKRRALLRPSSLKGGWNPLSDWLGKKVAEKIAEKIAQSKLGQAVARNFVDPVKQAIQNSRAWQAVAPRLQPLADAFNKIASPFRSISNALGAPERWLNSQLNNLANAAGRSMLNLGSQAIRGIGNQIGNLLNAARPVAGQIGTGLGAVGAGIAYAGSAILAIITTAAFWWVVLFIGLFVFTWWWAGEMDKNSNSGCANPGTVELFKSHKAGENLSVSVGENIEYQIIAVYNIRCVGATASLEIKDILPPNTTFVSASAKVNRLPTDPVPAEVGESLAQEQGTYSSQYNTVTWKINTLRPDIDVTLSLVVTPTEDANDSWVMNEATVDFIETRPTEMPSGGGFPPNQDNCNGKYSLKNPIGNYGDPACNFTEDALFTQLQQLDPANANYWFDTVIKCESSYNPNAWADHAVVGTPDTEGAWGLVQMGRGKNGQYDHGDVEWQAQTSNAINYNNNLARKWRYWACAQDRW